MNTTVLLGTLWPIGNAKEPEKKEHDLDETQKNLIAWIER